MEGNDQKTFSSCQNCEKMIEEQKINLHFSYCIRNVKKCERCKHFYDINDPEQHEHEFHTKIICKHCSKEFPNQQIVDHQKNCFSRVMLCPYCDLKVPQKIFESHSESCGSRTEICQICQKPVMNKQMLRHQQACMMQLCQINNNQFSEGEKGRKKKGSSSRSIAVDIFKSSKPPRNKTKGKAHQLLDLTEEIEKNRQKYEKDKQLKSLKQNQKKTLGNIIDANLEEKKRVKKSQPSSKVKQVQIICLDDEKDNDQNHKSK